MRTALKAGAICAVLTGVATSSPTVTTNGPVSTSKVREVHGGATIFAPANTWIEVTNIGTDAISGVFVFSAPGFEDFMRAESTPEGQKITPLTKAEDAQIQKEHGHAVIYGEP